MSTDEYAPSDDDMRYDHMHDGANPVARARIWDDWLAAHDARVHLAAAREALDGLAEQFDSWAEGDAGDVARAYRDTHYPETED